MAAAVAGAGCAAPDGDGRITSWPDACGQGVCPAERSDHLDWDVPPGAMIEWTFSGAEYASILALVRTDDGWAWTAQRAADNADLADDAAWVLEAIDGAGVLRRLALPEGHVPAPQGLRAEGGSVLAVHAPAGARANGTLVRWDVAVEEAASRSLGVVPFPTEVAGSDRSVVLLRSPGAPARVQDALWLAPQDVPPQQVTGEGLIVAGALRGATLLRAEIVGEGGQVVLEDLVTGTAVTAWNDSRAAPVAAAGGPGGWAFSVAEAGQAPEQASVLWLDPATHRRSATPLRGMDLTVTERHVYAVTAEEGTNPFVAAWDRQRNVTSEVAFLPRGSEAWAADGGTVWWLDVPRTDHRFTEAPNPTPYAFALYRAGAG